MNYENDFELIDPVLRANMVGARDLSILEELAREKCEHLTHKVSAIISIFQEDSVSDNRYPIWRQHWFIETDDGYQFCYPIKEEERGIYESGLVPDWIIVDTYEFNGKFYQVFIDGVLRNEHLENSPNRELSVYKSSLKQIEELGAVATKAGMNLKEGLV